MNGRVYEAQTALRRRRRRAENETSGPSSYSDTSDVLWRSSSRPAEPADQRQRSSRRVLSCSIPCMSVSASKSVSSLTGACTVLHRDTSLRWSRHLPTIQAVVISDRLLGVACIVVPRTNTKTLGRRSCFATYGPVIWNGLPTSIHNLEL